MKERKSKIKTAPVCSKSFYSGLTENDKELGFKMGNFYKRARYASFHYQNERSDVPCYLVERDSSKTEETLQKAICSKKKTK